MDSRRYDVVGTAIGCAGFGPKVGRVLAYWLEFEAGTNWDVVQSTGLVRSACWDALHVLKEKGVIKVKSTLHRDGRAVVLYNREWSVAQILEHIEEELSQIKIGLDVASEEIDAFAGRLVAA